MKVIDQEGYVAGILYMPKLTVEDITKKSGPLAIANEYQVHYNTLNYRLSSDDGGFVDVTIPTVVFNYPQTVSSAAIAFEMKDILNIRNSIAPLEDIKIKEINSKFYQPLKEFASTHGYTLSVIKGAMSNIHRHPGGMNRFSGTDYDTNPKNPGICFPLSSANYDSIYSSIILHDPTSTLAHTEYRVAKTEGETLNYYKGSAFVFSKGYTKQISKIFQAFVATSNVVPDSETLSTSPQISELYNIFQSINYLPDTQLILESNLKKETYTYKYDKENIYGNKFGKAIKAKPSLHVGKYPNLANFVEHNHRYANKLFKFKGETYLGSDILDVYFDFEKDFAATPPSTIEEMLETLASSDILDIYIEPYEEPKAPSLLSYKEDEKFYSYQSYKGR